MKGRASKFELLLPLKPIFQKDNFSHEDVKEKPPLRSELFTIEQLEQHASHLAQSHRITHEPLPEQLLKRLSDNEEILFSTVTLLQQNIKEKKSISPAAEWLLDNFYLIEEEILIGKRYLPKGYSKGLPKLSSGKHKGFPRVYDIAIEIISHSDGHVDINSLSSFISSYQKVNYLTLGELWAIPIMIRLALLENLSRVAIQIALDRNDSALANEWANKIIEVTEKNPKDLVLIIADMARSNPPITSAFVGEFTRKLQWKGSELSLPISWLEQHLSGSSDTLNSMILAENQKQAANQVSVSNSINSLRFIAKMEWREFVETVSIVEYTLRKDIDGIYSKMDFYTRDHYRHAVEQIAKESGLPEYAVAQTAIDLAHQSFEKNSTDKRRSHVGYYLIDNGRNAIEQHLQLKRSPWKSCKKWIQHSSPIVYVFSATVITILLGAILVTKAYDYDTPTGWLILLGIVSLLGASQLAIALTNWWATILIKPKPLPCLDFSHGIPAEYRTMVVVPTLVNQPQLEKLIENLEVRFLANRDENLVFALLTDFCDASTAILPEDEHLVTLAAKKIEELNLRYGKTHNETFFLFHRPRRWNPADKIWMGYERKRGKLSDLNHLLRGKSRESFSAIVGDERIFNTIKYIITLDTDTQLPRDAAWKLVGLMAHPMNRPVYDDQKKRVVEGYGIIQPRIAISLQGATRTSYSRLYENDSGIDPYTRVVSDVYQDVFGEGSFIGKGIYEIDTFEKALDNRFPENRILSHDLLEGSYTRCAFASDVQFYEEYPPRYSIDAMRRHRWIRGDWQIGTWFMPFAPGADRKLRKNSISALSRWKIFDNLRRSLIPVAQILLLLAVWAALPSPVFWTFAILAILFVPPVISSLWSASQKPKEIAFDQHVSNTLGATNKSIKQALFTLICLPYEAYLSADAIARTLWRMYISRKKLLEWNPSNLIQQKNETLGSVYAAMWIAPLLSIATWIYLNETYGLTLRLFVAAPFLISWIFSPALVWIINKPVASKKAALSKDQKIYLRELARKTWSFFEEFVNEADNWLPPDNLQQYPIPVIAHRTSPTNIGLSLLANLSAYDFGYITASTLIDRTSRTFATMSKLSRLHGHFYNWYDTQSLKALHPRYISTVDSGNLAGHLLTLRQGFLGLINQPVVSTQVFNGLLDTISVLRKNLPGHKDGFDELENLLEKSMDAKTIFDFQHSLEAVANQYDAIKTSFQSDQKSETRWWIDSLDNQLNLARKELITLMPWADRKAEENFEKFTFLTKVPTLAGLCEIIQTLKKETASDENSAEERAWLTQFESQASEAALYARERIDTLHTLAQAAFEFADIKYDFLYDKAQRLLSIGFNADDSRLDASFYDLLASEARLSAFVAIAQGKLPQESWFSLGRRLTSAGKTPVLLSWSGSMFEYLMPTLVMPVYENTLLDEMAIGTVKKQIEYGEQHYIPWGISESCYNVVDSNLTYQYRAFGVPGLGFKRGLGQDLVIAPYATVMALMVDPHSAYHNLQSMKELGFEGRYGFYEAVDYTPVRLSRGQSYAIIQTFMAHHQGMSLLSLAYLLLNQPMQKRFEADPQFQTALLLLQEQVPKTIGFYSGSPEEKNPSPVTSVSDIRVIPTPHTPVPEVQLLSNGRYHVMVTNAGGGYSRWRDLALTRWREDTTADSWGTFCYIRDLDRKELWSNAFQPTVKKADHYEAVFSQGKVEFRRRDYQIETYTEIIVSPEDDVEVRRVHLINHSKTKRNLEITTYAEVVIALPAADDSHPAFSKLFVQTEISGHQNAIVCSRRPRSKDEQPPWMFHLVKVSGVEPASVAYETDRSKFIGRGNTIVNPVALQNTEVLTGSQGSVLDPIVAVQYRISIEPGDTATIDMVTGIAATREANQMLVDKYQDKHLRDRAFELSWTHSQVVLRQIGATESDAQLYGRLASAIIYANPALRAPQNIVLKNQRGQSALWAYSISGDLPIVLLEVSDPNNITLAKQMIKAQAYWNLKGLAVDLVIINQDPSGYRQVLQDQIQGLIAGTAITTSEKPGRIFVRSADQIPTEDLILLQTVARVIISDSRGTLADQINKKQASKPAIPKIERIETETDKIATSISLQEDLQFFNGLGGFSRDGTEYSIHTTAKKRTPLPWVNVIANQNFGTIISESGSSYTWFENAHEFRLSPWHNDPVSDKTGEAFYLRDEETGKFWSPMPLPVSGDSYITRHGFGYTTFEHIEAGIHSETIIYVDTEASVKFITIKMRNISGRARKLSVTGYVEWVLGSQRPKAAFHVVTELESNTGALMAKNPYSAEFGSRVAFLDADETVFEYTTDRTEFLGRNGSLQNPDAMTRIRLSGKTGACLDPCAAMRIPFELENDREHTITFRLGAAKDMREAIELIKRFQGAKAAVTVLENVRSFWKKTLGAIEAETPDPSINILVNGWLEYQVLSSRLWGRSGFYQSGGAFGFRDQLQDVLALMHAQPQLTRKQILLSASRQFKEGDVQHWWHPPLGRGVRTLCSDDYLWLPFVTSRYITATHDTGILDETVPFLQGRLLNVGEESYYDLPVVSDQAATVYEHCKASVRHGLRFGEHGLPLIGSGDWNDGMNMVGIHGKGESVWLAFFLYDILTRFKKIAEFKKDLEFIQLCEDEAKKLKTNINAHAWDGKWYMRAYFDDGSPLGSHLNSECMIDAIAQSWAVLSEAGEPDRIQTAMHAANQYLINREKGLIQLLEPPFDKADMDPGYIKGYVPGVRENGGQYTHAAIWMVMAFARLNDRERTFELLSLINPINHGKTPEDVATYKAEPYVMAADVYGVDPHTGRGGWTWYTGSAGWMYQLITEYFLGIRREGNSLIIEPRVPADWKSFTVNYTLNGNTYAIETTQHNGQFTFTVNGLKITGNRIDLHKINQ